MDIPIEEFADPKKYIRTLLEERCVSPYLQLSKKQLDDATEELAKSSFQVKLQHLEYEIRKNATPKTQLHPNPLAALIGLNGMTIWQSFSDIFHQKIALDMVTIIKQGPRIIQGGKQFYSQHKAFYENLAKNGPDADSMKTMLDMVRSMAERKMPSLFKQKIERTLRGLHSGPGVLEGYIDDDAMHYVSSENPFIMIHESNQLKSKQLLLGYGMNNCLGILDLLRYSAHPDARIFTMWWLGEKVGMSYDIAIPSHLDPEKKIPLVDSIELSDRFYALANKLIDNKQPEHRAANQTAYLYLMTRLQAAEHGIYVLAESNNPQVAAGMMRFVKELGGTRVLVRQGHYVQTDTLFERVPFYVPKENLQAHIQMFGKGQAPINYQSAAANEEMARLIGHLAANRGNNSRNE